MIRIYFYIAKCLLFVAQPAVKNIDNGCRKPYQTLQQYFKWRPVINKPLIMAHRMSPLRKGYADNGLRNLKIYLPICAMCYTGNGRTYVKR